MRDKYEGMIEFIDAFEKEGHYFVIIERQSLKYQFGISRNSYRVIRNAMQIRPFDKMPGLKYRYFHGGSSRTGGTEDYSMELRVELNRDATQEQIPIPKDLHANLLWFARLVNPGDADYLRLKENVD